MSPNGPLPLSGLDHPYGRVGSLIGEALSRSDEPFLVIENSESSVAKLRALEIETIMGNAAQGEVLQAANPLGARCLVVAIPEAFEAGQVVQQARIANRTVQIIARAHSDAEVEYLAGLGADSVVMEEREIARAMIEELERNHGKPQEEAVRSIV